jgi:hypothetical protein
MREASMTFIEIALSDGVGTLTEHYVSDELDFVGATPHDQVYLMQFVDESRYDEFIFMHGSERAV